jgi:hypothetical protein
VEIDIGIGAEGKVVLDGNEVHVESTELIERVRHGHAACTGPALVATVEADMEKSRVENYKSKQGERKPEHREFQKIGATGRIPSNGRC